MKTVPVSFFHGKGIFSIIILLLIVLSFKAYSVEKTANITGKVTNHKGEAIASVRIAVNELRKQTFTGNSGEYKLDKIPFGTYKFMFSRIGYARKDTTIKIDQNDFTFNLPMIESDVIYDDVVVTGTRSYKDVEDMPIPTEVITKSEIQEQGNINLQDVLMQSSGLVINAQHGGSGAQMEGLDAGYILVLLNGEPVSSRVGGAIDWTRFSVGTYDRMELVQGPSSSLYGSNAFAGVINLITEKPSQPLLLSASGRYGSNNTSDISGQCQLLTDNKNLGATIFLENYNSDGYKLNPNSITKTIPQNSHYNINGELFYDFDNSTTARLSARFVNETAKNNFSVTADSAIKLTNDVIDDNEANFNFSMNHKFSSNYSLEARLYGNTFSTNDNNIYQQSGLLYDSYTFKQREAKGEIQSTSLLGANQLIGGFGFNYDDVRAQRLAANIESMKLLYGYLQDDWQLLDNVDVIVSLRLDDNNNYPTHLSPKIAASWSPLTNFTIRGSVGNGFKAPTFEELYLDWNNADEGYSVLGTKFAVDGFNNLNSSGQISQVLIDPTNLKDIVPEKSTSYNFGFNYGGF